MDAMIRSEFPNLSFGDDTFIQVGRVGEQQSWGLTRFDISSIPAGSTIQSAVLFMYCERVFIQPPASQADVDIDLITSSWNESVTWNTRPSIDGNGDILDPVTETGWYETDEDELEKFVQAWVDGESTNYGFLLWMDGGTATRYSEWTTRVADSGDEQHQPYLEITYLSPSEPVTVVSVSATINGSAGPVNLNYGDQMTEAGSIGGTGSGTVIYHWEYKPKLGGDWTKLLNHDVSMADGSASISPALVSPAGVGNWLYRIVTTSPDSVASNEIEVNVQGFSISGRVISRHYPNFGVAGVTVSADTGQTTTTAGDGSYTLTGFGFGTRTLTASRADYFADGTANSASQPIHVSGSMTGVNFGQFSCKATPDVSIAVDDATPFAGQTVNVTVTTRNADTGVANVQSYLDLSVDDVFVVVGSPSGTGWSEDPTLYPVNSDIYNADGNVFKSTEYLVSALREGSFAQGASISFSVPITVKSTGAGQTINLKYRATIGDRRDPVSTGSGTLDQQDFNIFTEEIVVEPPAEVTQLRWENPDGSVVTSVEAGQTVYAKVTGTSLNGTVQLQIWEIDPTLGDIVIQHNTGKTIDVAVESSGGTTAWVADWDPDAIGAADVHPEYV